MIFKKSLSKKYRDLTGKNYMLSKQLSSVGLISAALLLGPVAPVSALATTSSDAAASASSNSAASQLGLTHLKTRGDAEINRRLTTLNKLTAVINSTVKLSSIDKASLTTEVSTTISGLTALKTQLDGETELASARTDVQAIISDYRVYALVAPKVYLLKTADTELANADKLTALAGKLQARLSAAKNSGKNVTSLLTTLDDMNTKISAAQTAANAVNAKVAPLQPSDYNTDRAILEGQRDQLKTAHQDNLAAYDDAKTIASGLKNL